MTRISCEVEEYIKWFQSSTQTILNQPAKNVIDLANADDIAWRDDTAEGLQGTITEIIAKYLAAWR